MLAWFRARGRSLAVATFVLLSAAVAANAAVHGIGEHDRHGAALVVHDASAHAFTGGSAEPQGETLHCVLCHLTRTVRPAVKVGNQAPTYGDLTLPPRRPGLVVPAVFPAAEPPLRSPPISL